MDRTPPEVWVRIFSFACLDTGFTGRSLSLVSKYICEVSKPVKFQSIALHGHDQILAFAALLERIPPHLRRVRNLLVSFYWGMKERQERLDVAQVNLFAVRGKLEEDEERLEELCLQIKELEDEYKQVVEEIWYAEGQGNFQGQLKKATSAFNSILCNVASTVEILEVDLEISTPIALPCLTDLTIYADFPLLRDGSPIFQPCHSLRRLHLGYDNYQEPSNDFFGYISSFAPSLTHICFSCLQQNADLPAALGRALRLPDADAEECHSLPQTVELVLIKPDPVPSGGCGNPVIKYSRMMHGCRELQAKDHDRVVLLRPSANKKPWEQRQITSSEQNDWLDAIVGGKGCWNTSDFDTGSDLEEE